MIDITKGNLILNGNCLDWLKEIPNESVDMVLTDPPYGMNYQSNRRVVKDKFDKIANDNNLDWIDEFISESYRVMKNNTAIYIFCSWHKIDIFKQAIEKKFKLKNIIVWNKNNHGSGDLKGSYAPKHEFVLYAHKGRSIFREKRVPDVLDFPKISSSNLLHPTEKNTDMLELFVKNNTDEGDIVLDCFAGSGTTGLACANTKRKFLLIEKEQEYFEVCKNRLS